MEPADLARILVRLGCPTDRSVVLARQLDRRARMDADRKGIPYEHALEHLLGLMAEGWAAPGQSRPS
ncbi:hypothetical protein HQ590_01150 [bacterium]|nr:hypothetical protein [bacterium]